MTERRPAAIATRLTRLDLVGERRGWRALAPQLLIAAAAVLVLAVLLGFLNAVAPRIGPYAPAYPLVLFATLLGRLRAGLAAWIGTIAYVALVPLPPATGPLIAEPSGPMLTAINVVSMVLMVLVADAARAEAAALLAEREARIAERDMLLEEVDHRLKNNLAMLSGLLELQIRETAHDETREILTRASARLESIGQVYRNLRYEPGSVSTVDAAALLDRLCASLREALGLEGPIHLECEAEPAPIARDRASALALLVNEVVTNAAKHAFTDRVGGSIRVRLGRDGARGGLLEIADDGRGMDLAGRHAGRGRKLLDALARMAGGRLAVASGVDGTRYRLELPQLP